jgi:hypothetical protein
MRNTYRCFVSLAFLLFSFSFSDGEILVEGKITGGVTSDVVVVGELAYVPSGAMGLGIYNISEPSFPELKGFCDTPYKARRVAVAGDYAYVADSWGGLRVIDVSDPSQMREVGFYDTPGDALGVAVTGDYAYVADSWGGLRVIDVNDPSQIREVGPRDGPGM